MRKTLDAAAIMVASTLGLLMGMTPATAGGATIDVNAGESIQAAVNAAESGDTIVVHAGTYTESVKIAKSDITLVGDNGPILHPGSGGRACNRGIFGICVGTRNGDVVSDVTISGFIVENFPVFGVVGFGTENLIIAGNDLLTDGEYGAASFDGVGTKIIENLVSGNAIGAYIGDSPNANAEVARNRIVGNTSMGVFIRSASVGTVHDNTIDANCVGLLMLNEGTVTPSDWTISFNTLNRNNIACAGDDSGDSGGAGLVILGGDRNIITENVIARNHSRTSDIHGGVILLSAGRRLNPDRNRVIGNDLVSNRPNIVTDGTGRRNVFRNNNCTGPC